MDRIVERARMRVSEGSCGLCGLENLEQVMRPLPALAARAQANAAAIFAALDALSAHQPLTRATGSAHAAAFCNSSGDILATREDIGRHNALDKLIGALARGQHNTASGFILLTARCSYELVEKTVIAGCPMLVTISAPSTLAIDRASAHGLTVISLARADSMLVVTDPHELFSGD
jgi:FdhD protein